MSLSGKRLTRLSTSFPFQPAGGQPPEIGFLDGELGLAIGEVRPLLPDLYTAVAE
ncbi:MAG: hypothetical protein R3B51_02015 [Thermodesulfobacteriota bacterium]